MAAWDGPEWVKPLVLALEQESSHPIAAAFRRAFDGIGGSKPAVRRTSSVAGSTGWSTGCHVVVGSPAFVEARASDLGTVRHSSAHLTPVLIAVDGDIVASRRVR